MGECWMIVIDERINRKERVAKSLRFPEELMAHEDYLKSVKKLLPAGAFAPNPKRLWSFFIHLVVIVLSYLVIRYVSNSVVRLICSLAIGNSLACFGFLSHELSHNTIIRTRGVRYVCEVFFWGMVLMPATVWRRVHNQAHHLNPNNLEDPDRPFLKSDTGASRFANWYIRFFFPHNLSSKWRVLVGANFLTYSIRNTLAAFWKVDKKLPIVPSKVSYSSRQRLSILGEIFIIGCIQIGIFNIVGANWAYLWAGPIPLLVASSIVMSYIFTNHFLNPLCEINDPLVSSTSVEVHPLVDRLHYNFSLHSEHHLFPGMNSDYYPGVSKILKDQYPERYNRIAFSEAWMRLWRADEFRPKIFVKMKEEKS